MSKLFCKSCQTLGKIVITLTFLLNLNFAKGDDASLRALFKSPLPKDFHNQSSNNTALINLGRNLYYEEALSKSGKMSCNSCHDLNKFGVDNLSTSPGHEGKKGDRNSPTSLNAAGHIAQFWDGRAPTVEEQAKGPILNPGEMGMPSAEAVELKLRNNPTYVEAFKKAFPEDKNPITFENVAKAIGAFERGLVSPAKFDEYLSGDSNALTEEQKKGLNVFVEVGCATCHNGPLLGGSLYQKAGIIKPWPNQKDLGRFNVTKLEGDKFVFKVPSLRNVTKTGPYFHDGTVPLLSDAIKMMGEHQLGRSLTGEQVTSIQIFLESLTGMVDPHYIARDRSKLKK
jgi:cytochrome c peroxidase